MRRQRKRKGAGDGVVAVLDWARPYAETAQSKAGPMVGDAQQKLTSAATAAASASEPYRREAKRRGANAWLALKGEAPEPSRKRRWARRILVVGGVAGGSYVAYRIYRSTTERPVDADEPDQADQSDQSDQTDSADQAERAERADRTTPPAQRTGAAEEFAGTSDRRTGGSGGRRSVATDRPAAADSKDPAAVSEEAGEPEPVGAGSHARSNSKKPGA